MSRLQPTMFALLLSLSAMAPLSETFAQGMFLDKGMSGVGVSGGLSTHSDYDAARVSLGYSVNGIIDLDISGGKTRFHPNDTWGYFDILALQNQERASAFTADYAAVSSPVPIVYPDFRPFKLTGTTVSPSVTVHLLRQDRWMPVSLSVSAAYERTRFHGQTPYYPFYPPIYEVFPPTDSFIVMPLPIFGPPPSPQDYTSRGFSFGATVYRSFPILRNLSITPEIGFQRRSGTLLYHYWYWDYPIIQLGESAYVPYPVAMVPVAQQVTYREYVAAVHLSYRFASGLAVHLTPEFVGTKDNRRYSLYIGFIAPKSLVF